MKVKDEILARMYVLLTLVALVPVLVAVQVARITLLEGPALRQQGETQAMRPETIPAMRGSIVDRVGRTLVVNTARYDIAVDPTVSGFDSKAGALFERLARNTQENAANLRDRVNRRSSPRYVLLARGVDEETRDRLIELEVPGLLVTSSASRRYSYGVTAAHLLGHVDVDMDGLAGVERQYDEALTGTDGWRSVQVDRRRRVKYASEEASVDPDHGETVVLTIDLVWQTILEEELARGVSESGAAWGTAAAMDPRTGEILALANVPTYDPNHAGRFAEAVRRNHAVNDRLEPGSTFKLVTAVAAIEQDLVELTDTIDTGKGWVVQHGITLRDTRPLGRIPFIDVISESSNIGVAQVAERLDRDTFYRYARALGFGTPTWIDLPGEVSGSLKKPGSWSGTTLSAMSRGYEVEATPIQLLAAYGALANDGMLVQPYVVKERRDLTGRVTWRARQDSVRRAFKASTARELMPAFERVVTHGTGQNARVQGVRIAGKTGTAWKTRDGAYAEGAYRATFVGLFPFEDPQIVLIVVLDEPQGAMGGGSTAAPIFQRTVERWLVTMPEALSEETADSQIVPLPDRNLPRVAPRVTRWPASVAAGRVRAAGLTTSIDQNEASLPVTDQVPEEGAAVEEGDRIRLTLAAEPASTERMPDVTGMTGREAAWLLVSLGVTPRLDGSGLVKSQSPTPGSPLPREAVLRFQ